MGRPGGRLTRQRNGPAVRAPSAPGRRAGGPRTGQVLPGHRSGQRERGGREQGVACGQSRARKGSPVIGSDRGAETPDWQWKKAWLTKDVAAVERIAADDCSLRRMLEREDQEVLAGGYAAGGRGCDEVPRSSGDRGGGGSRGRGTAMASKTFEITLLRKGGMSCIPIPFDPKEVFGKVRAPVRVTINGYTLRSTIAAMGGPPFVPLRRSHREAAGLEGTETLRVRLDLDTERREITPPPDLVKALKASLPGWERWQEMSYTHQRDVRRGHRGGEEARDTGAAGRRGGRHDPRQAGAQAVATRRSHGEDPIHSGPRAGSRRRLEASSQPSMPTSSPRCRRPSSRRSAATRSRTPRWSGAPARN